MKMKHCVLTAAVIAFVGLSSFKASKENNDLLVSKTEQVNQQAFTKVLLGKNEGANLSSVKVTPTLALVVVFALAYNTPALSRIPREPSGEVIPGSNNASSRMKTLDSN